MFPLLAGIGLKKIVDPYHPPNTQVGSISTQPMEGNSLTQQMRSIQNYMSTQGEKTFNKGQGILDQGLSGFPTAQASAGEAMDTTRRAGSALDPAEDYWTKLLSGDQKTMNEAISPFARQAGTNYANATSQAGMNGARGGYSSTLQAGMPFAQARDVNEQLYKLQPAAAQGLNTVAGTRNTIAGTQGNIAGIQGQLATWLSSLGIDVSKLGQGFMSNAIASLLEGRGQDVGEHGQAMQLAGQTASTAFANPGQ